jgi:predicted alpha/beta superfamily hydrolase
MKPAFTLHSPETGTEYVIFIEQPAASDIRPTEPLPCVLFLDGDDQFPAAVSSYRDARKAGELPPLLLAGLGYGASYSKPANRRGRDYTPTHHDDEPSSGGAENFVRFLTTTLWPELGRRYSLSGDQRGIAGHSLGSLLALYALWREPLFFTHCLASAPSIWWDDRSILEFAARRQVQNPELPARLFLGVGEEDSSSMTGDLELLERQLTARPFNGLDWTSRRFPRRNHFNVLPDAFRKGMVTLFGTPARSSS